LEVRKQFSELKMTEWFDQRYISREEHDQVVAYYRKQVAQLYEKLCELRTVVDARNLDALFEHRGRILDREGRKARSRRQDDNVISVDFRRTN